MMMMVMVMASTLMLVGHWMAAIGLRQIQTICSFYGKQLAVQIVFLFVLPFLRLIVASDVVCDYCSFGGCSFPKGCGQWILYRLRTNIQSTQRTAHTNSFSVILIIQLNNDFWFWQMANGVRSRAFCPNMTEHFGRLERNYITSIVHPHASHCCHSMTTQSTHTCTHNNFNEN